MSNNLWSTVTMIRKEPFVTPSSGRFTFHGKIGDEEEDEDVAEHTR